MQHQKRVRGRVGGVAMYDEWMEERWRNGPGLDLGKRSSHPQENQRRRKKRVEQKECQRKCNGQYEKQEHRCWQWRRISLGSEM